MQKTSQKHHCRTKETIEVVYKGKSGIFLNINHGVSKTNKRYKGATAWSIEFEMYAKEREREGSER